MDSGKGPSKARAGVFFTSAVLFYLTNKIFPVAGMGDYDEVNYYRSFSLAEAKKLGVHPLDPSAETLEGIESMGLMREGEKGPKSELVVADGAY